MVEDRHNNMSESDAYTPYGIVDESFIRTNTDKNSDNVSSKIDGQNIIDYNQKIAALQYGLKNIDSALTRYDTEKEGSH